MSESEYDEELGLQIRGEFQRNCMADPLYRFLPNVEIQEKDIRVEWLEPQDLGAVTPGMPNKLSKGKAKSFVVMPAYFRRGLMGLRNEAVKQLSAEASLMLSVLRASMLTGGINYSDYSTGVSVNAPSGIPEKNIFDDVPLADSKVALDQQLERLAAEAAPETRFLIMNPVMAFKLGAVLAGNPDAETRVSQFNGPELLSYKGAKVVTCGMLFDDMDESGKLTRKYAWPIHVVTAVAADEFLTPGNTYICKGEHPNGLNGSTGVWIRELKPKDPVAGPSTAYQVGVAGLPILNKPSMVGIIKLRKEDASA